MNAPSPHHSGDKFPGLRWSGPETRPDYGPDAEVDLQAIADQNFGLAKRLIRLIDKLLYEATPSTSAVLIPDPPGEGPRYFIELRDGYGAVYWVVPPPVQRSGSRPRIWIERVLAKTDVARTFAAYVEDR